MHAIDCCPCCWFPLLTASAAASSDTSKLIGHGGPVNSVAISPDGRKAISGSLDYAVMLWDLEQPTPRIVKRFTEHRGAVSEVLFLPSGDQALSGGDDGIIYLWDTVEPRLLHRFVGHEAKVVSLDVTPDARLLASASWDGTVRVWDLAQRRLLRTISVHKETVHAALISADGSAVYSGGFDGRIRHWDMATGGMVDELHNHGWPINIMRWLPGEREIIFGTTNGDVQLLDITAKDISKVLIPHSKPVLGLAVMEHQGLVATGGNDGVIRVWRIKDWSVAGETGGIPGPVWALAFTEDGRGLYFGSLDDSVNFWRIAQNDNAQWGKNKRQRRFQVTSGLPPGELQFARKCSVCHNLEPGRTNRAGPSLHKLLGRKAGSLPDYPYSTALQHSAVVWDRATIDRLFVQGPNAVVPGSKMPLQTIPDDGNRAALIDYLIAQ